ncbi:MAG: PD40 domain-containing protein, partial [Anaerolineae bacterium]|nr:PD40 domain-containing protein [Anaerolineae bacterium]
TFTPTPAPTATPTPRPATVVYVQSNGATHNLGLVSSVGQLINGDLHRRASAPTWAPDGRRVAFYGEPGISDFGGIYAQGTGVWLIDVPTGALELLYAVDHIHSMAWSPDGSKLALEVGPPGVTHQVFIINAETGEEISRFPGEQPAWGPDGGELIIKSCNPECGLWRVGFDGGSGRLLTPGSTDSYPTWSPDGRFIVYTSRATSGDWEIYRLDLETNVVQPLTSRAGSDTTPVFSSDGREIYFRTDAYGAWRVMAMAIDGTGERLVQDDVGVSEDWGLARPAVK